MDEKSPFFPSGSGSGSTESSEAQPIFEDKIKNKRTKVIVGAFLGIVAFFIGLTIIMVSVKSYKVTPLYVLLLVNLLAVAQILIFMVFFVYTERLSKKCFWAIFVFGIFVIVESINTDIIVFSYKATS